jgi:hypothetical protein
LVGLLVKEEKLTSNKTSVRVDVKSMRNNSKDKGKGIGKKRVSQGREKA